MPETANELTAVWLTSNLGLRTLLKSCDISLLPDGSLLIIHTESAHIDRIAELLAHLTPIESFKEIVLVVGYGLESNRLSYRVSTDLLRWYQSMPK